eukprot:TRINITY_DN10388_c0_g1_i1.p1 TRINITY_DN10388_c0_g1~~TRINITY_DN10388_c0_g1_i1.p1  ORF type:complete len:319 (+),score=70.29 TRINITY_DN10388_c0_g1_i1:55-957(+)
MTDQTQSTEVDVQKQTESRGVMIARHKKELKLLRNQWNSKPKPKQPSARKQFNKDQKKAEADLINKQTEELKLLADAHNQSTTENNSLYGKNIPVTVQPPSSSPAVASPKKISRAQKRREVKAAKEREWRETLEKEKQNLSNDPREKEQKTLKEKLSKLKLTIKHVAPDGNCLYNAIVDQLKRENISYTCKSLRYLAADYILLHRDEFVPFMDGPESIEVYCENLKNTSVWGGQLELQALTNVVQRPINVYSAYSPVICMGEHFSGNPLLISYHKFEYIMGEHYNSCVPEVEEEEFKFQN